VRPFDVRKDMKTTVLIGGALLLANAAAYGFFVRPRINAFHDLEGSRAAFKKELTEAEKTQKTLSDYYEKLQGTKQNIDDFYEKTLGSKQEKLVSVQREVIDIASECQISPGIVSYDNKENEESGIEQFGVSVPVEGDYTNLRRFIAKLESSKSFLIVEGIQLTGTKEGGLTLQLQIKLTTFFNAPWLKETKKTKGVARRG
jgi:Tfp pilus assembly protein PilO